MRIVRGTAIFLVASVVLFRGSADGQSQLVIQVVSTFDFPGTGNSTTPFGINSLGDLTGDYLDATSVRRGFIRLADGTLQTLVEPNGDGSFTRGRGINSSRTVAGDYFTGSGYHGFTYSNGVYSDYSIASNVSTDVYGINDSGHLAGAFGSSVQVNQGFLDRGGNVSMFSIPASGAGGTFGIGINNADVVVGDYFDVSSVEHAYMRFPDGSANFPIDGPGATGTTLDGINDGGWSVGRYLDTMGHEHGLLFITSPNRFVPFDFPGAIGTSLNGINRRMISGRYTGADNLRHGFVAVVACDSGVIANGGFESGSFTPGWMVSGTGPGPVVNGANPHTGNFSALLGNVIPPEPVAETLVYQQFTVPANGATLGFWHWDHTTDNITHDWQDAYVTDGNGTILQTIFHHCANTQVWVHETVDLTPYAGQNVRVAFLVHQDGSGNETGMYVDDVAVWQQCPVQVVNAVSRKTHGAAGNFDVSLPLSGTTGVECRSGGGTNDYEMVITFGDSISVDGFPQAEVTSGTALIGSGGASNGGAVSVNSQFVTVPLTAVANAQTITVRLNAVNGWDNVTIPMSILIGDTNANRTVNAADVAQTKSRLGQTVDATNFRSDVNANGSINAADTAIIKQHSGTSLPP
jgi:hypothetical protein